MCKQKLPPRARVIEKCNVNALAELVFNLQWGEPWVAFLFADAPARERRANREHKVPGATRHAQQLTLPEAQYLP